MVKKETKNNYCVDCGRAVDRKKTKRCKQCFQLGKLNHGYKTGRWRKNNTCNNCKKSISRGATLCRSCQISEMNKIRWKNKKFRKKMIKVLKSLKHTKITKKLLSKKHYNCQGNKNPNWKGGLSYIKYPLKFNNKLKEFIRKRDNYICQLCYKHQRKLKSKLYVHHKDYNKRNCSKENLISLCNSCHTLTNYNRDYWYAYFTYIMEEKNVRL